ncbi:melanoma cell adhesion molecule b [Neosynchiropus ocellatus]
MAARTFISLLGGLLVLLLTRGAWGSVEVTMEDRVEVFRGNTTQITCMFTSADGLGGVTIQWFYMRGRERQRIYYEDATTQHYDRNSQFKDRLTVNSTGSGTSGEVVMTISDVRLKDELEYVCVVKSLTDGVGEGRTMLRVFETPQLPTIEAVQQGISVSDATPSKVGICEVKNGYPSPNITWYRNLHPLRNGHDGVEVVTSVTVEYTDLYSVKSELHMVVKKEDKDAQFYCEVTYHTPGGTRMTETKPIQVTVFYPSTSVSVWVESPKGLIKEGDTLELLCQGDGHNPAAVMTIKHDLVSVESSLLLVENVTRLNSGVYECSSLDSYTFDEVVGNTSVFVNYLDPAVVVPEHAEVTQGENLEVFCNALSSRPTHTAWFKDGKQISAGHRLTLNATKYDTAGTYMCVVTVPEIEGMKTDGMLRVHVTGPPEILNPDNTELHETYGSTVNLNCDVRGFPAPIITWHTPDGEMLKANPPIDTKDGVGSVLSLKVSSDIVAVCNSSNEHGSSAIAYSIKALTHTPTAATIRTPTISTATVNAVSEIPPKKIQKESNGVIIAVIIICILLLAILGSVLYFLYKKGKICGRSGKQDLTKEKSSKDNIVVEMKSDNTEEAILLGVNGEKLSPTDQVQTPARLSAPHLCVRPG